MAFFSQKTEESQNGRNRRPAYSRQVTDNVQVAIWTGTDKEGRPRYSWGLGKVNPANDAKPYKTFRPEELLEIPKAITTLSNAFADAEELDQELRLRLATFAVAMSKIETSGKAYGRDVEANGKSASVLAL